MAIRLDNSLPFFWALLLLFFFYASGASCLLVSILYFSDSLPDVSSSFWTFVFPLSSAILPRDRFLLQRIDGTILIDKLPFLFNAIPGFIGAIFAEACISVVSNKPSYRINDSVNSMSLGLLSDMIQKRFSALVVFPYKYIYEHYHLFDIPSTSLLSWVVVFVGVDFCYYWFHRLAHEINFLWVTHIVHHSSEEYNLSTALRQALLSNFAQLFYIPLALFVPIQMLFVHTSFNTLYQFWIHTRFVGKLGILEYVLNTPSHHRVHHGRNPYCIDKNYGGTLIIFDRLFGTFQAETEEEIVYGVVPPLRSWNVYWDNWHHVKHIIKLSLASPSWFDKVLAPWRGPGWYYNAKSGGRYLSVGPIGSKFNPKEKFNPYVPVSVSIYCLAQYFCCVKLYLFMELMPFSMQMFVMFLILVSIYSFGALFEKLKYAPLVELGRLCLVAFLGYQVAVHLAWNLTDWSTLLSVGMWMLCVLFIVSTFEFYEPACAEIQVDDPKMASKVPTIPSNDTLKGAEKYLKAAAASNKVRLNTKTD